MPVDGGNFPAKTAGEFICPRLVFYVMRAQSTVSNIENHIEIFTDFRPQASLDKRTFIFYTCASDVGIGCGKGGRWQ
jgi:hypothetical protein